jgi:hypothetical protein
MAVLRDVSSPELHNHRDVYVYLPPSYAAPPSGRRGALGGAARFPVLYMHDGQNLFDPELSFSGAWRVDLAMHTAARLGYEAIVVGVANTGGSRIDEYSPFFDDRVGGGGTADRYVDFLLHTLKPAHRRAVPHVARAAAHRRCSARRWAGSCAPSLIPRPARFACAAYEPVGWLRLTARSCRSSRRPTAPGRVWLDVGTGEGARTVVQRAPALRPARPLGHTRGRGRCARGRGGRRTTRRVGAAAQEGRPFFLGS